METFVGLIIPKPANLFKPTPTSISSSGFLPTCSSTSFSCFIIPNGHSSFGQNLFTKSRKRSLMVEAKKGKNNNKLDSHSFKPKPDEAIGPFPEAILLKQKKVQEDGRALPEFADEDEEQLFEYLNLQLESDLGADQMRHYEVVFLIHQDHEDKVDDVNTKIRGFVKEKKGRLWRFSDWGMRRLAYKIQKTTHAHYILMNFELGTQWINEFKQMLDQDERVIRHLVIKRDKAITKNCPPPPKFHTLRADMVDEYEVDDMEDYDEDDEDEELDLEGDEDDDIDDEDTSSTNIIEEGDIQKALTKEKTSTRREKVLR